MSLQWDLPRKVPEDTAALGQKLLAPDNAYRQIGDQFAKLFPDQGPFVPLYYSTGRGAIPPLLLALVTILQMLEKVSDRVAAEWVVSRLDWKYALHLLLDYPGFHFTDLYAFRQRLLELRDALVRHLGAVEKYGPNFGHVFQMDKPGVANLCLRKV